MFQLMDTILRLVIKPDVQCDCHQCLSIAQVQTLQSTLPSQFPWDLLILSPVYIVTGETKTEFQINVHVDPINHKWLKYYYLKKYLCFIVWGMRKVGQDGS